VERDATAYETICRACTVDLAEGRIFSLAARHARIVGALDHDTTATLARCSRGHRLVVRRRVQGLAQAS
jgi:hypothetical protein